MNIDKYEFDDVDIEVLTIRGSDTLYLDAEDNYTQITKRDAIAIANHFKLTINDLSEEP